MLCEGDVVLSIMGHDIGRLYVVLKKENQFLYLVDGKFRKKDNPKKKREKHTQKISKLKDFSENLKDFEIVTALNQIKLHKK